MIANLCSDVLVRSDSWGILLNPFSVMTQRKLPVLDVVE
jgi:hypothetical protein